MTNTGEGAAGTTMGNVLWLFCSNTVALVAKSMLRESRADDRVEILKLPLFEEGV
jgi:hypothetical protein